tara:strand:- start:549 stop:920 length:372 start_codon:yes stop_codon:yes gene_type:complete
MGFKLGKETRLNSGMNKNIFDKDDASVPGVRVIRKELEPGIDGEANNDGTIFIGDHITPGSAQERKVLMHEMKHMVDMQTGKLSYTDDSVSWNGDTYQRLEGMIKYEGRWYQEGSDALPWEQH